MRFPLVVPTLLLAAVLAGAGCAPGPSQVAAVTPAGEGATVSSRGPTGTTVPSTAARATVSTAIPARTTVPATTVTATVTVQYQPPEGWTAEANLNGIITPIVRGVAVFHGLRGGAYRLGIAASDTAAGTSSDVGLGPSTLAINGGTIHVEPGAAVRVICTDRCWIA